MAKLKTFPQAWALEVQEDIHAWLGTHAGSAEVLTGYLNMFDKAEAASDAEYNRAVRQLVDLLPVIMKIELNAVSSPAPTFCTADYSSMLLTMATAAPNNSFRGDDVAYPEGLLVFESPIHIGLTGVPDIEKVRAFSWYTEQDSLQAGMHTVYTRAWAETRREPSTPQVRSRHKLFPTPLAVTVVGPVPVQGADHAFSRLLQAHFALLKSPLAANEPVRREAKFSPRTKRSLGDSIRRVYLRHPEYAAYEADEAAAAREGRAPMRAHWVRGHWRNQHYSTANENRWIWIDGYIKGNPENGTVSTRKVGVARASASEVRELALTP